MKFFNSILIAVAFVLSLSVNLTAQSKSAKPFSVSCAKALQIGVEKLESLHDAEMRRRAKGKTDSGTEGAATVGALKNYIGCRRGKNAAELKTFTAAATIVELKRQESAAQKLARMRFDNLIYGVSWDDKGADSINYPMTLRAVALVEDFKGALIYSYGLEVAPDEAENAARAEREEKLIQEILQRMDNRAFEDAGDAANYKIKLTKFKAAVNRFLKENSDLAASEKAAATNFIISLLKLGSNES